MQRDPKLDAQIPEEAGLTAAAEAATPVANPDAPGEEGVASAAAKKRELDRTSPGATASTAPPPAPNPPAPSPAALDRRDQERATDEGMAPPSKP